MNRVIRYSDNVFIEIAGDPGRASPVDSSQLDNLSKRFDGSIKALESVIKPIVATVSNSVAALNLTNVDIELSASFSTEGNLFVCKGAAEGALKVTISIAPKKGKK